MNRYLLPVICSVLIAGGAPNISSAQGSKAAAQVHLDKAKAAAYRPGTDMTALYERVCAPALAEKGPQIPKPTEEGQASPKMTSNGNPLATAS